MEITILAIALLALLLVVVLAVVVDNKFKHAWARMSAQLSLIHVQRKLLENLDEREVLLRQAIEQMAAMDTAHSIDIIRIADRLKSNGIEIKLTTWNELNGEMEND